MKTWRLFFAILAVTLTGCGTSPYAVKFSEDADDFKIKEAVIAYLLDRHFWDNGDYSAIFIGGEDSEVKALIRKFPDHIPPIKPAYRAELHSNRAPLDKDTGRPGIILSGEPSDPTGDTVDAVGRWYAGEMVSGARVFSLRKTGGEWTIESVK